MKAVRTVAMVFLILIAVSAVKPEWWTPAQYDTQFRDAPDAPPSTRFLLGTDSLGRDRLSRLLHGTRVSLVLAPAAALLSCLVAGALGGVAGLAGGWLDRAILAAADLFLSVPWLFLLLMVRACLPLNVSPCNRRRSLLYFWELWGGPRPHEWCARRCDSSRTLTSSSMPRPLDAAQGGCCGAN